MGLIAGINAALRLKGSVPDVPPSTAHGALIRHITKSENKHFQPSNINFGLFPATEVIERIRDKKLKRAKIVEQAINAWSTYISLVHAS
jgi:methylenetetrahydrofolate--tRNA-(uracil-5-)-methyltransferase